MSAGNTTVKKSGQRSFLRSQSGVALAILVWFLAAMSLLVAGIVMQARVDIKLAQLHATRARVEAAADGAIQLALADLMWSELNEQFSPRAVSGSFHSVGDIDVSVSFVRLSGLVDLNMAPQELLFVLFAAIEGMDEEVADELSASVVKWRYGDFAPGQYEAGAYGEPAGGGVELEGMTEPHSGRFEAIEDLLLIQGVDRRIFEAIQDSVYVAQAGQAGVDWVSAPVPVLRALGEMDDEAARDLAESRSLEQGGDLLIPEGLNLDFQAEAELSTYRADALVVLDDTVYLRRRWVDRARGGADGLPWRFFRTEAVRAVPLQKGVALAAGEGARAGS